MESALNCRKCHQPIAIVGLDANYCRSCGWIETLEYLQRKIEIAAAKKTGKADRAA